MEITILTAFSLCFYPQTSVALTPYQRSLFVQPMDVIILIKTWRTSDCGCPAPTIKALKFFSIMEVSKLK